MTMTITLTLTIISYTLERVRDQGTTIYDLTGDKTYRATPDQLVVWYDGEQLDRAKMFFHRGAVIDSSIYYAKNMGATG